LATELGINEDRVDLIDLPHAGLAMQILIKNAIGKAKQILKSKGEPVPVSAYDAFSSLERIGQLSSEELPA